MKRQRRVCTVVLVLTVITASFVLTSCGSDDGLTIYTDQHKELIDKLADEYTEKTGTEIRVQADASVGQIRAEKSDSPADVFLSEDPGPVAELGKMGKLVKLDGAIFDGLRDGLSSPDEYWAAYAARIRVAYYNPELIDKEDMPDKLADVVRPEYEGKFAYAPSGAFAATVQYLIAADGESKTAGFLKRLKSNGVNEHKNGNVRDTVEAGRHAFGLTNHYYWWIKAAENGGPDNMTSKIYHFPDEDPGNLVFSSGAGILKSSEKTEEAADFISWLTDKDGGQAVIAQTHQYPVAKQMKSEVVGSLDEAKSPTYDMGIQANIEQAEHMLKKLGMAN